jgi:hypothetical protein
MIEELPQRLAERSMMMMMMSTIAVRKKLFWRMQPGQLL